jgi:predicted nucleic acid-binding Zn ribbon protein
MAIDPLDSILKTLRQDRSGQDQQWQQRQAFDKLQRGWTEVVGEAVAAHAQPIALQRGILQVATSSAVWSQNLSFQRHLILRKLIDRGWTLRNIQFSPAQWADRPADPSLTSDQQHDIWKLHPSRLPTVPRQAHEPSLLPESSFDLWASTRRRQLQHLPLCPICQVPTPPGEIDRWTRCSFCMTQRWNSDKLDNAARIDDLTTSGIATPAPGAKALLKLALNGQPQAQAQAQAQLSPEPSPSPSPDPPQTSPSAIPSAPPSPAKTAQQTTKTEPKSSDPPTHQYRPTPPPPLSQFRKSKPYKRQD